MSGLLKDIDRILIATNGKRTLKAAHIEPLPDLILFEGPPTTPQPPRNSRSHWANHLPLIISPRAWTCEFASAWRAGRWWQAYGTQKVSFDLWGDSVNAAACASPACSKPHNFLLENA